MSLLQEITVPQESVNDLSVTLMSIFADNGSLVKKGDQLMEMESSKATFIVSAEIDGYIEILFQPGDEVMVGQAVANIYDTPFEKQQASPVQSTEKLQKNIQPVTTLFSEKARELMATYHLSETDFSGYDFVNADDVNKKTGLSIKAPATAKKAIADMPVNGIKHHTEKLKVSKKREIEYLQHVQSAGLNSQVTITIDVSGIFVRINQQLKYFKNSILPLVIYECSRLLRKYPELNAFYGNDQITYFDDINMGIALDIDDGLKTVNLEHCDTRDVQWIEEELMALSEKYLSKTLSAKELSGITFTITDLSAENILFFTPLINRQNAAILGISSIQDNNKCCLTMSFDHRITAGKNVSRFLQELKLRIESYKSTDATDLSKIKCFKCLKRLDEDFSEIGFLKVINQKGIESYICQTCMKGF
jgi:pyruvate/2-oxoglutarate dehydrogenase complex dihydrolipoamide acyltransferase (E2) component